MNTVQRTACRMAEGATSPEEVDMAHRAMVAAFPRLARAFPCPCANCEAMRAECTPVAAIAIERLTVADELQTAQRVADQHGLTLVELLAPRPPRDPKNKIVDLYELLDAKGYSRSWIAHVTGRAANTVIQALRYRRSPTFRDKRLMREKLRGAS